MMKMSILLVALVLIGFGLGIGIIIGYFLGRRATARENREGFAVLPAGSHPKDM
jgi:uncharacterized protein YneF (UPF0154 family)